MSTHWLILLFSESALIQLNITDKDVDDSDNLSLTFDFGNENGYFRFINQSLYVQGEALDFEQTSTFTLVITARDNPNDGSSLTGSTIVTVKVNQIDFVIFVYDRY